MAFIKRTGDQDLLKNAPIWVSRPDSDGTIYKWHIGIKTAIWFLLLAQIAAFLWLLILIITAIAVLVIGAVYGVEAIF